MWSGSRIATVEPDPKPRRGRIRDPGGAGSGTPARLPAGGFARGGALTCGEEFRMRDATDPTLTIIHVALLAGVLTLAAVVYFLASQTATIEATPMLRWGWLLTSAGGGGGRRPGEGDRDLGCRRSERPHRAHNLASHGRPGSGARVHGRGDRPHDRPRSGEFPLKRPPGDVSRACRRSPRRSPRGWGAVRPPSWSR